MTKLKDYEHEILERLENGEFDGIRAEGENDYTDWEWKVENGRILKWSKPVGKFFNNRENEEFEPTTDELSSDREKINHMKKFWYKFDIDNSQF